MGLLSSKNRDVKYSLFVMYDGFFHQICLGQTFKDKKAWTVLLDFIEIVDESKYKLNKLWVDQETNLQIVLCKNS